MSGGDWGLVIAVLASGLAVGGFLVWRLGRRGGGKAAGRELELADLERRQEELYARLKTARAEGDEEEAQQLEHQAAVNLRSLETLREEVPAARRRQAAGGAGESAGGAAGPSSAPAAGSRQAVVGFVAGLAVACLVGVLIYFAQRDAGARAGGEQQATADGEEHPEGAALSAEDRARIEQLRQAVEASPSDLSARKRYALALLGTGQFFHAFQQAQEILEAAPQDPDGLYVAAMVRLQMGQDEAAVELFDGVLSQFPQHVLALTGKGVAMYRAGNELGARVLWQQAMEASGGKNPQVEHLLEMLEARVAEEGEEGDAASGPVAVQGGQAAPVEAPRATPSTAEPAAVEADGTAYRLTLRLAEGAQPPPSAVLFVTLRGDDPGPPAAVRRIAAPSFPLEITLSAADSMLGRPLPESGTLGARLDGDGNAMTREEGDLEAESPATAGSTTELVLGSASALHPSR